MFLELHILQNFAPSNLNRDDTNSPKECEFGGHRRARISSQCLKRAIRTEFKRDELLTPDDLASRTKRVVEELSERLVARGRDEGEAERVATLALAGLKLKVDGKTGKTQYLLFLAEREIEGLAGVMDQHWDALVGLVGAEEAGSPAKSAKAAKAAGKEKLPPEVVSALGGVLDGGRAADLALFGRMIADIPGHNVDASCQVAHAISANAVAPEFDFYTAVDDLKPDDTSGADMLGTVEFNSACFYRYANLDIGQLRRNLGGDEELAKRTVEAFVRASVSAVPTGKQNSMAAHNPPSLICAVVRKSGLQNLANAFVAPMQPRRDGNLVVDSVRALNDYRGRLQAAYDSDGEAGAWVVSVDDAPVNELGTRVTTVSELVSSAVEAAVA
jgi:CRISPR system Cascade subunit CasC